MGSTELGPMAVDFEETTVPTNGGDWRMAWWPPGEVPPGLAHGANAFCVTGGDEVVLISTDGGAVGMAGRAPGARRVVGGHAAAGDARRGLRHGG
jgi:hypothetical protein